MLRILLKLLCGFLFRVKLNGADKLTQTTGGALIVANHLSPLDGLLLALYLPQTPVLAIDKSTAGKWYLRPFAKIHFDPSDTATVDAVVKEIGQGKKCIVFPEGRISRTGALMKIYEAPGMIADKSGAVVLPVHIDGSQYSVWSPAANKGKRRLLPKVTLTIMPPCRMEIEQKIKGSARHQLAADKLYDIMSNMAFVCADYRKTLFQSLIDQAKRHGRRHVIAEDIKRIPINYGQLLLRCFLLGEKIKQSTSKGEYTGLMLPNSLAAMVSFYAMQAYGRIPTMLNFTSGRKNITAACRATQLKTVYTARQFIEVAELNDIIEGLRQEKIKIVYLEDLAKSIGIKDKLKWALASLFPQRCYNGTGSHSPKDTAAVLFTSGSEGVPKGVALSHLNLQSNRHQVAARIDFVPTDIIFNTLPIFHSFGLTGGMLLPSLSGIRTFFYPSPLHYRIVPELIYDTGATITFATDTFLTGYAKHANPYDLHSLRYVFAGAEKLKQSTRQTWADKYGVRVFEGYGVTETSPVLAVNTPMHSKPGTVGRLVPGIQYRLQPVDGIAAGGRLIVEGPNIMQGYIKSDNPGKIARTEEHDTGDIVTVDRQGYITIAGRAKRFAKIAGEMVSLTAVEISAAGLWPDHQHAAIAIPDSKTGEAIVLATTNKQASRKDLGNHNQQQGLSTLHTPKTIITIEDIPLTGTGKTDYQTLQQQLHQTNT